MGMATAGANMVYLAQQQKREGCATTEISGATHGNGDGGTNGGTAKSATESAAMEHTMATSIRDINEDGDDGSSHGTLGSAVEHGYCTTARLKDTAHGDGDSKPSSSAYRSTPESATNHKNCAKASRGCSVGAHGEGDSEPSSGTATAPPPSANHGWLMQVSLVTGW
jgi:hypothetical protein